MPCSPPSPSCPAYFCPPSRVPAADSPRARCPDSREASGGLRALVGQSPCGSAMFAEVFLQGRASYRCQNSAGTRAPGTWAVLCPSAEGTLRQLLLSVRVGTEWEAGTSPSVGRPWAGRSTVPSSSRSLDPVPQLCTPASLPRGRRPLTGVPELFPRPPN